MPQIIASVVPLLVGWAILNAGNNLQVILLPLRAGLEAFPTTVIGLMGGAYYLGFITGCLLLPRLIGRVGHIRAFAALAAVAATVAMAHGLLIVPGAWVLLRAVTGAAIAGLCLVVESWLNERSENATRGRVLSFYMTVNAVAAAAGQMLLPLTDVAAMVPFALASMMMTLSLVPVSAAANGAPAPAPDTPLDLGSLYRLSPVGVVGCFALGLANASFWALAPVFAQARGLSIAEVAMMTSAAVAGGALAQWPLGRLSDRVDRRRVIFGAALVAGAVAAGLAVGASYPTPLVVAAAGLFGAAAFPIYALCIAHANDHLGGRGFVAASGGLLLTFGLGAVIGPVASSILMGAYGDGSLFLFTAAAHAGLALFTWHRMRIRAPVPAAERSEFVALPRTSPAVFALDPRAEDDCE